MNKAFNVTEYNANIKSIEDLKVALKNRYENDLKNLELSRPNPPVVTSGRIWQIAPVRSVETGSIGGFKVYLNTSPNIDFTIFEDVHTNANYPIFEEESLLLLAACIIKSFGYPSEEMIDSVKVK